MLKWIWQSSHIFKLILIYQSFSNYPTEAERLDAFQAHVGTDKKPIQDAQLQASLDQMVDRVYAAYQTAFPKFMSNKAKPMAMIQDSDLELDASSVLEGKHNDNHVGLIIASKAFVISKKPIAAKIGLLAHEFAHLYFWDREEYGEAFNVRYASGKSIADSEIYAFQRWLDLSTHMGLLILPESGGALINSHLGEFSEPVFEEMYNSKNPKCGRELLLKLADLMDPIEALYSNYDSDLVIDTPAKLHLLKTNSDQLVAFTRDCTERENFSKMRVRRDVVSVLHLFNIGNEFDLKSGITFDQMFEIARKAKEALAQLSARFDSLELRYDSVEDRADETAVVVLKKSNIDPAEFANLLLGVLGADEAKCSSQIAKGSTIPYGRLSDSHHAPCWRVDHLKKFARSNRGIPNLE
jgi:hypothetical protein